MCHNTFIISLFPSLCVPFLRFVRYCPRNEKTIPINVVSCLNNGDDRQKRMEEQLHHIDEYIPLRSKKITAMKVFSARQLLRPSRILARTRYSCCVSARFSAYTNSNAVSECSNTQIS